MINTKLIAFAKTPGLTPVKTRLAKTRGEAFSEKLYQCSLECTAEVLRQAREAIPNLEVSWTVAEESTKLHAFWKTLKLDLGVVQTQAKGSLGEKLHHCFKQNFREGTCVGVLGTDLPQISKSVIERGISKIAAQADFVIGPSRDGGFYLLLGRKNIPLSVWASVKYSCAETRSQLIAGLKKLGTVEELELLTDIDEEEDLKAAKRELHVLKASGELLPSQALFLDFLSANL